MERVRTADVASKLREYRESTDISWESLSRKIAEQTGTVISGAQLRRIGRGETRDTQRDHAEAILRVLAQEHGAEQERTRWSISLPVGHPARATFQRLLSAAERHDEKEFWVHLRRALVDILELAEPGSRRTS